MRKILGILGATLLFLLCLDGCVLAAAQKKQNISSYVTDLRLNFQKAQQHIELLELQSERLRDSISELNGKIAANEQEIGAVWLELRGRLLSIYKYDILGELNLLLSAQSTHEAIVSAYLLSRISRHQTSLIEDLVLNRLDLENAKVLLTQSKTELARQTRSLKQLRETYGFTINKTTELLSRVRRQSLKKEQTVSELELAQKEITAVVVRNRRKKGTWGFSYEPFAWPLRGSVVGFFGTRTHPMLNTPMFRTGIDIRAAANVLVKSSGAGEVFFQGRHPLWGRLVCVDHGFLTTVYAYLGSVSVQPGDHVEAGTSLGTVGKMEKTGTTQHYGLRFEVYEGEQPRNPLEFLKKR